MSSEPLNEEQQPEPAGAAAAQHDAPDAGGAPGTGPVGDRPASAVPGRRSTALVLALLVLGSACAVGFSVAYPAKPAKQFADAATVTEEVPNLTVVTVTTVLPGAVQPQPGGPPVPIPAGTQRSVVVVHRPSSFSEAVSSPQGNDGMIAVGGQGYLLIGPGAAGQSPLYGHVGPVSSDVVNQFVTQRAFPVLYNLVDPHTTAHIARSGEGFRITGVVGGLDVDFTVQVDGDRLARISGPLTFAGHKEASFSMTFDAHPVSITVPRNVVEVPRG